LIFLFIICLFISLFFRSFNHSLKIAGFFQAVLQIGCCAVCFTDRVNVLQINRWVNCLFQSGSTARINFAYSQNIKWIKSKS